MGTAPTNAAEETDTRFEMANGRTARQNGSNIDARSDAQGIFEFNAKIAHGAVDLRVTKQQLNGTEIAGLSMNLRCFGPAQGMGTVPARLKPNCSHPIANKPSIPAG